MGIPAQPVMRPRRGIALPAALGALVLLSILVAAMFTLTQAEMRTTRNRVSASRALMLAEEGAAHTLVLVRDSLKSISLTRLLRGSDDAPNTSDDGLLTGYGLSPAVHITDVGRTTTTGSYTVRLLNDTAELASPRTDNNGMIIARCIGTTSDGSSATLEITLGTSRLPSFAADGNLTISGNPELVGQCGGAHSNDVTDVSGTTTATRPVTATGDVTGSGTVRDPYGNPMPKLGGQPPVEIPVLSPGDFCGQATYTLKADGTAIENATGNTISNPESSLNWKRSSSSPVMWDMSGNWAVPGTYCVEGNAKISGNPGTLTNPAAITILATGSVEISGNPQLKPFMPDVSIIAGGDLKIAGNTTMALEIQEGLLYAAGQCMINGNPTIHGQMLCKNLPNPPGAVNLVDAHSISGNPVLKYDCTNNPAAIRRVLFWAQR